MRGGPDHGTIRGDFPGGFPNDGRDAFSEKGRTAEENDIFNFTRQLLKIRSSNKSLQTGSLIHFKPKNEVYAYFRVLNDERIMVIINHNTEKQKVDLLPFASQLQGEVLLRDMMNGKEMELRGSGTVDLEGMSGRIFQILRPEK